MAKQRSKDTQIELGIRRRLHGRGFRYRVHVRPLPNVRREADIVFRPAKVAIFIDGCFWHGCPEHATWPSANADWWRAKIERNRQRDAETDQLLADAGWRVIRIWEHEDLDEAVELVATTVAALR
jgi:DNA mismatch endonuclease, patch repair protein